MKIRNVITLLLLFFVTFSFSGCSIKKADKYAAPKTQEIQTTDSDNDGLTDAEERKYGTDSRKKDTDDDGLSDKREVWPWNTDPNKADTDGDGYSDGEEVKSGYNPLGSGQLDSDLDELRNADELKLKTDPDKLDTDTDGLSDYEEVKKYDTDPMKQDTDGDGLTDKEEIRSGRDPHVAGK